MRVSVVAPLYVCSAYEKTRMKFLLFRVGADADFSYQSQADVLRRRDLCADMEVLFYASTDLLPRLAFASQDLLWPRAGHSEGAGAHHQVHAQTDWLVHVTSSQRQCPLIASMTRHDLP